MPAVSRDFERIARECEIRPFVLPTRHRAHCTYSASDRKYCDAVFILKPLAVISRIQTRLISNVLRTVCTHCGHLRARV